MISLFNYSGLELPVKLVVGDLANAVLNAVARQLVRLRLLDLHMETTNTIIL